MKHLASLAFFLLPALAWTEVTWDLSVEDFAKATGEVYVYNLTVGDKAKIEADYGFCTTSDGKLAIDGTVEVGSGDVEITVLPGTKIAIKVDDEKEFLEELIEYEAYAECSWWTAHQGKYIRVVDNVNGKTSISSLGASK